MQVITCLIIGKPLLACQARLARVLGLMSMAIVISRPAALPEEFRAPQASRKSWRNEPAAGRPRSMGIWDFGRCRKRRGDRRGMSNKLLRSGIGARCAGSASYNGRRQRASRRRRRYRARQRLIAAARPNLTPHQQREARARLEAGETQPGRGAADRDRRRQTAGAVADTVLAPRGKTGGCSIPPALSSAKPRAEQLARASGRRLGSRLQLINLGAEAD